MPTEDSFIATGPLRTPVLLIAFNRLDTLMSVFEAISKARPPRLYIAVDGPRENHPGEFEKVQAVREFALNNVGWSCELKTLFRDKNLGCKNAVSSAINWFFEHEEQGIILEDDCLPGQSFFWFCEELLEKYKNDIRIGQISGFNPLSNRSFSGDSYLFSKFGPIWGWASWRRAWENYDVKFLEWPDFKKNGMVDFIIDSFWERSWREFYFDEVYWGRLNTWDYQWAFCKLVNNQLSIIPAKNLISNIGFGKEATHTSGTLPKNMRQIVELPDLELKHPKFFIRNRMFEKTYLKEFAGVSFWGYCKIVIKRIMGKILS